jgi:hypothetical protein
VSCFSVLYSFCPHSFCPCSAEELEATCRGGSIKGTSLSSLYSLKRSLSLESQSLWLCLPPPHTHTQQFRHLP